MNGFYGPAFRSYELFLSPHENESNWIRGRWNAHPWCPALDPPLFRKKTHFVYRCICLQNFHKLDEILCVCNLYICISLHVYIILPITIKSLISTNNNKYAKLKFELHNTVNVVIGLPLIIMTKSLK